MPGTPILTDRPDAGDILSVSQVDLQNNAAYVRNAFNKDHQVDFGQNSSGGAPLQQQQGRHKQVSFINNALRQIAVPAGTDGILHESNGSGNPNLYWRGTGMASSVQLTNFNATPISAQNGASFLPSPGLGTGIMIQWGVETGMASGASRTVMFPIQFSAAPYSVVITQTISAAVISVTQGPGVFIRTLAPPDSIQFVVQSSSNLPALGNGFYWIAIGPK